MTVNEGEATFSFNGDVYDLDSLGFWSPDTSQLSAKDDLLNITENDSYRDSVKHLVNNPHQFFYKNAAQLLLDDMKDSAEFKLMYDYLFPMKNYMSLGFMYAGEGLTKYIPDPTQILQETKSNLFTIMINLINSNDYTFLPDPLANQLENNLIRSLGGTTGKDPDMNNIYLKLILETMFMVLKNFVEMTDPAVIIAKRIIDATNAIVMGALAGLEGGLNTAKAALNGAKVKQEQLVMAAELSLQSAAGVASGTVTSIKDGALAIPSNPEDPNSPTLGSLIKFDTSDEDPTKWTFTIDPQLKPESIETETTWIHDESGYAYLIKDASPSMLERVDKTILSASFKNNFF